MGIAVAVLPDTGAPQVGVTITGLDPTTPSTISVQASTDTVTWWTVRGADHLRTTSAVFIRDYVPPLNRPTTYRLTVHSGPTTPTPTSATITVPSPTAWVQDPLNPTAAVAVDCWGAGAGLAILSDSFETLTRVQPSDTIQVLGARLPVASVGTRSAPSGMRLHLRAALPTQDTPATDLRTLLDTAGILVLRGLPQAIPLDPVAHVITGAVDESPVVGSLLGERNDWALSVTQVRPTTLQVLIPWWTYAEVATLWSPATYADALASRPGHTYLDWAASPVRP